MAPPHDTGSPDHSTSWLTPRARVLYAILVAVVGVAAFLPPPVSDFAASGYVIFHTAAETLAIAAAAMICVVGWAQPRTELNGRVVILTAAFLGAALLDLAHLLSFPGMPDWVTPNSTNKTIYFWLAARYCVAIALVLMLFPFAVRQTSRRAYSLSIAIVGALVLSVVLVVLGLESRLWPMFIEPDGLTPLKVTLELGVSIIALAVLAILSGPHGDQFLPMRRRALQHGLVFMALSGFYFVSYETVNDFHNGAGHILKIISYGFLIRALFIESVASPRWQLMDSQARLEATLSALPDMVFEVDAGGRFHHYHGSPRDRLQSPPEAFIGRTLEEVLPDDVSSVARQALGEAQQVGGRSQQYQYTLTVHGELRWFQLVASLKAKARRNDDTRIIFVVRDVTDEKQALADQQLNAIAFHTKEAIMITDSQKRIVRVNPAFTDITGYSEGEVIGHNPSILSSGQHDADFYRRMWQAINEHGAWSGEIWNRRKDGQVFAEHVLINSVQDRAGEITHYIASFSDITQQKAIEERVVELAYYDPLTRLANRRLLLEHVRTAQQDGEREGDWSALLFIDLDYFKSLNDSLGHSMGDEILRQMADRLREQVQPSDILSRPGGDEFIILARHLGHSKHSAAEAAEKLGRAVLAEASRPFHLNGSPYSVTVSIGVALFHNTEQSTDTLMSSADLAMYQAKEEGRNQLHFFEPAMQLRLQERNQIEGDLNRAIDQQQFELYFQAKIDRDNRTAGYEALIRWHHPERGLLPPGQFIELAESTGQIVPISRWVLSAACSTISEMQSAGRERVPVAVNVSERHIREPEFVSDVRMAVVEHGIDPGLLHLEITESMLQQDIELTRAKLIDLSADGIHIELDDFGTGYSSMAYLKSLPIDVLKIDQSFVLGVLEDGRDEAIVRAVISLAHALELDIVAEGVETTDHFEALRNLGCEYFQGYLWGRPQPWADLSLSESI